MGKLAFLSLALIYGGVVKDISGHLDNQCIYGHCPNLQNMNLNNNNESLLCTKFKNLLQYSKTIINRRNLELLLLGGRE